MDLVLDVNIIKDRSIGLAGKHQIGLQEQS
jgi:hypothetical protein